MTNPNSATSPSFDIRKLQATAAFLRQTSAPWSEPVRAQIAAIEAAIGALAKCIEEQAAAIERQIFELDISMNAELLLGMPAIEPGKAN